MICSKRNVFKLHFFSNISKVVSTEAANGNEQVVKTMCFGTKCMYFLFQGHLLRKMINFVRHFAIVDPFPNNRPTENIRFHKYNCLSCRSSRSYGCGLFTLVCLVSRPTEALAYHLISRCSPAVHLFCCF